MHTLFSKNLLFRKEIKKERLIVLVAFLKKLKDNIMTKTFFLNKID